MYTQHLAGVAVPIAAPDERLKGAVSMAIRKVRQGLWDLRTLPIATQPLLEGAAAFFRALTPFGLSAARWSHLKVDLACWIRAL